MGNPETGTPGESAERLHPRLEDVVGYRDGDLSPEGMAEVDQHVAACVPCRERLAAAEAVLAQVDLIAERPLLAESLEIELLLERLRLLHEAEWENAPRRLGQIGLGIRSRARLGVARVRAMAKSKRKSAHVPAGASGADAALAVWGSGDLRTARAMARELLSSSPSEADRAKLERLLADTSPDPRALHIAIFCVTVVALVVLLTKLFG